MSTGMVTISSVEALTHTYKTKKGAYFLGHSTQWQGDKDSIEVLSEEEAKEKYEHLPEHEM